VGDQGCKLLGDQTDLDCYNGEGHQDDDFGEDHLGILVEYEGEGGPQGNLDDFVGNCLDVLDDSVEDPWEDIDDFEDVLVAKDVSSLTLACSWVALVGQGETGLLDEGLVLLHTPPQDCKDPPSSHTALLDHFSH